MVYTKNIYINHAVVGIDVKRICVFLIIISIGISVLGVCEYQNSLSTNNSSNRTILRMAVPYADDHPSVQAAYYFAELVEERTLGRIQIQVCSDRQLGNEISTIEQMEFGGIAFSVVCTMALPKDAVTIAKYVQDSTEKPNAGRCDTVEIQEPNTDYLSELNLKVLSIYDPDYRCVANNKHPFGEAFSEQTDEQYRLTIQVQSSAILENHLSSLGLMMVQQSDNDLAASLNYGYIDGAEMAFLEYVTSDYIDILPYLTIIQGLEAPDVMLASAVSMGNLSGEDQQIISDCAIQAADRQQELLKDSINKAIDELRPLYLKTRGGL